MIRKFFGLGDVFIHAASDTTLKGVTYKTGEQIAYFSGVPVSLEYLLDHKQSMSTKRELSYTERHPQALNIGSVPNTKELEKIFFKKSKEEEVSYSVVDTYEGIKDYTIFLKRKQSPLKIKTFSRGKEIQSILNDDNTITLHEDYERVDVISEFKGVGERRSFDKPELGYVSIKATIMGKVDGKEEVFLLDVPKADLVSEPQIDLSLDSNYNVSLSFALINEERNKPTVVQIDDN